MGNRIFIHAIFPRNQDVGIDVFTLGQRGTATCPVGSLVTTASVCENDVRDTTAEAPYAWRNTASFASGEASSLWGFGNWNASAVGCFYFNFTDSAGNVKRGTRFNEQAATVSDASTSIYWPVCKATAAAVAAAATATATVAGTTAVTTTVAGTTAVTTTGAGTTAVTTTSCGAGTTAVTTTSDLSGINLPNV